MQKLRVSSISYANSIPFLYGLLHDPVRDEIEFSIDYPALCADKLISKQADLGLIPIAETLRLPYHEIISDYCIGATGPVRTVMLLSQSPHEQVKRVYLDYQSRTSVNLIKILAKNYWKQNFEWIPATQGFEQNTLAPGEAIVLIGDRCFSFSSAFAYQYDLAQEWINFSGLPFVFAAWIANCRITDDLKERLNRAFTLGVSHIDEAIELCQPESAKLVDLGYYLRHNISYQLDEPKMQGMQLFLRLLKEETTR
jgi:chorismate dehydratase